MSGNLDQRLLAHWKQSQQRQRTARKVLERASIPADRFDGWALDLIGEAFAGGAAKDEALSATPTKRGIAVDDR